VCVCGICNVWVCVCVGVCICGICNGWVCVCVGVLVISRLLITLFFIVCTVCFVFFLLCIFILIYFFGTNVRTTATE